MQFNWFQLVRDNVAVQRNGLQLVQCNGLQR